MSRLLAQRELEIRKDLLRLTSEISSPNQLITVGRRQRRRGDDAGPGPSGRGAGADQSGDQSGEQDDADWKFHTALLWESVEQSSASRADEDVASPPIHRVAGRNVGFLEPSQPLGASEETLLVLMVGDGGGSVGSSQEQGIDDGIGLVTGIGILDPLEIAESPTVRRIMPTVVRRRGKGLANIVRKHSDGAAGPAMQRGGLQGGSDRRAGLVAYMMAS
jgi:hypothetical protein